MSDESHSVRRLGPTDLADARELLDLFGTAFAEPATYGGAVPDDAYLRRLLGREHVLVLVADRPGGIAGGLVAYELEKLEQARSEIYIYDLAVATACRRRGVATALIGALQRIAAARGAWVIFVQADHGDDPAIALYTKLGSREDVLHFDIPVPPSDGGMPRKA
ncbi:AAC(3)-I family aminoglycoside N-acetyltransferase [Marinibaculum pumilum]|uniref:AAC(3)-I family aminoglycoside N-acetyltransferase n=1 Tax=Marinibaculum pumilum TaxID=1766165 RepID=A0ABV7KYJ8_9PROT